MTQGTKTYQVRRTYAIPQDVAGLIDKVHLIDGRSKSAIVSDSIRTVCVLQLILPSEIISLANDVEKQILELSKTKGLRTVPKE